MKNRKYNRGISILEVLLSIIIISFVLVLLFSLLGQVKNESVRNNISSTFIMEQSLLDELITNDILDFGIKTISSCLMGSLKDGVYNKNNKVGETTLDGKNSSSRCIRIEFDKPGIKADVAYIMVYQYYTKYGYNEATGEFDGRSYTGKEKNYAWAVEYTKGYYTYKDKKEETRCSFDFTKPQNANTDCDMANTEWHRTYQTLRVLPDNIEETVKATNKSTTPTVKYTNMVSSSYSNYGDLVIPIETTVGERYDLNIPFSFKRKSNRETFCHDLIGNGTSQWQLICTQV